MAHQPDTDMARVFQMLMGLWIDLEFQTQVLLVLDLCLELFPFSPDLCYRPDPISRFYDLSSLSSTSTGFSRA